MGVSEINFGWIGGEMKMISVGRHRALNFELVRGLTS